MPEILIERVIVEHNFSKLFHISIFSPTIRKMRVFNYMLRHCQNYKNLLTASQRLDFSRYDEREEKKSAEKAKWDKYKKPQTLSTAHSTEVEGDMDIDKLSFAGVRIVSQKEMLLRSKCAVFVYGPTDENPRSLFGKAKPSSSVSPIKILKRQCVDSTKATSVKRVRFEIEELTAACPDRVETPMDVDDIVKPTVHLRFAQELITDHSDASDQTKAKRVQYMALW